MQYNDTNGDRKEIRDDWEIYGAVFVAKSMRKTEMGKDLDTSIFYIMVKEQIMRP